MTKEQKFLLLIVLIIAGASVSYYYMSESKGTGGVQDTPKTITETPSQPQTNSTQPTGTPSQGQPSTATGEAKKYSVDITYPTPEESQETIHVMVTLKDGLIDDLTFTNDKPHKSESKFNITNFEKALSATTLKGKKLSEVSLSRVGGASLTTNAFMDAIKQIDTQSKNG